MTTVTSDWRASRLAPLFAMAFAATAVTTTATAEAAPSRVAVLGPSEAPILPRIERNLASMKLDALHASVTSCTRDVIARLTTELRVETALCTDGDQIGLWTLEGDRLVLKDAVVIQGTDDRAQELAAARATTALQSLPAKNATPERTPASSFTIVANGSSATIVPSGDPSAPPGAALPSKDSPSASPTTATTSGRVTPHLVLGVGPGVAASRHGSSFALTAEAEIGVTRYVALVPWLSFVPANRTAEATAGTATFRPTLFGLGFGIPLLRSSSVVVPRLGAGYGILWMHVSPETAAASASMKKPEDLLAPFMYGTAALSVKVASSFRVVGEGMLGVSSADMIVRIGNEHAAHWGVPLASASMRGEWVLQ